MFLEIVQLSLFKKLGDKVKLRIVGFWGIPWTPEEVRRVSCEAHTVYRPRWINEGKHRFLP